VKIFTKGKYLSEEQSNEFLDIWRNHPVITTGIKSKIVISEDFKDKFHASL
jgi:hypothetical protein